MAKERRVLSEERKRQIADSKRGVPRSEETKQKIRATLQKVMSKPETKIKMSHAQRARVTREKGQ